MESRVFPSAPLELVALLGPTASGKSSFAIQLAQALAGIGVAVEIVNSDAMQVYRHMDIGTAKAPLETRNLVSHHLIDIIEPDQDFTAQQYRDYFDNVVRDVRSRGKIPLVVGGSMFYISSALDELDFSATDPRLRLELEQRLASEGNDFIRRELAIRDPEALASIPAGNSRRLLRALEVNILTGERYRHALPEPKFRRPTIQIGLEVPRPELVARIDERVNEMWRNGLIAEVRGFGANEITLGRTASAAIGYKQALAQIAGELTEAEAISETQFLTRRYARRQMSWFRRDVRTVWVTKPVATEIAEQIRLML